MAPGVSITWDDDDTWSYNAGGGAPRVIVATPAEIEENYAEVRWVSPGEDRFRYVVGASYYDYDFLEERYGAGMDVEAVSYGALLNGMVPEFEQLTGLDFVPDDGVLSENATNTALFFNLGYDLTETVTVSAEGRYQSDKVGGKNNDTGLSGEVKTKSFLPRFAITYSPNETSSYYLQWSKGVNPAGINVGMLDEDIIASVNNGIDYALVPYDAALDVDADLDGTIDIWDDANGVYTGLDADPYTVAFDADTFASYREEEIINIEFGFKGSLLDGKLSYAGAVYMIDWKDQLQDGSIQWGSPCADGANAGTADVGACTYTNNAGVTADYFYVDTLDDTSVGGIGLNYGDVKIYGLELEGTYRINNNWDVRGSASYLQAEYDSYCDIALYELGLHTNAAYVDALGIEVLSPGSESTIASDCYVVDGNDVAGQPNLTASISPSYSTDIAGMRFNARLDISYEGERWLESGNYGKYAAVSTGNLSFSLSEESWQATLYINNITDEDSPRQIGSGGDDTDIFGVIDTDISAAGSTDFLGDTYTLERDNFRFAPRIPRTIGMRLNYNF
jgi:outer membrane receptor protein involved in Fe transport